MKILSRQKGRIKRLITPSPLVGRKAPRTPQEQEMVKREIESTDGRIDRLVYELYGLTEDEVKIVES